jgi:DNA-binding LytR/AlgR family response regulator
VIVNCKKIDSNLNKLINCIKQYTFTFQVKSDEGARFIPAEEVYYIDSVDGKTFLYSKEKVYQCPASLADLESKLVSTGFVRISKNCIMNTSYLESVNTLWNHRLEAILNNGERLVVARHYIHMLKEKIMEES